MIFEYIISGFVVGTLVGLTGVGGGSLMTPLLVLFFKFPTAVAVGTDLLYAAITKSAGAVSHHKLGHVDWKIVKNLLLGSLPASYLVTDYLKDINLYSLENVEIINASLGIALVVTSIAVLFQPIIIKKIRKTEIKNKLKYKCSNRSIRYFFRGRCYIDFSRRGCNWRHRFTVTLS